jgi:hypothetical protein
LLCQSLVDSPMPTGSAAHSLGAGEGTGSDISGQGQDDDGFKKLHSLVELNMRIDSCVGAEAGR